MPDAYDLMKSQIPTVAWSFLVMGQRVRQNFHHSFNWQPWGFLPNWSFTGAKRAPNIPWDIGKIADVETLWTSSKDSWNRLDFFLNLHTPKPLQKIHKKKSTFSVRWPFLALSPNEFHQFHQKCVFIKFQTRPLAKS